MHHRPRGIVTVACALTLALLAVAPPRAHAQATSPTTSVRGRVLGARTGAPLSGAHISVVGTDRRTMSREDGSFVLSEVPIGERTLRAVAIGYAPASRVLVVAVGPQAAPVEIVLAPAAFVLDQLVVTATGEQARRAVPNAVATVMADSVARTAPVTTVDQLLTARVPGVQILPQAGVTGSAFSVRIRGRNSIQLANEPLWIIDGIRLQREGTAVSGNWNNVGLAALNPSDIETIDVIRGPAAAALYGTQASNGVLVVTTKRGRVGATRWRAYSEAGRVEQPARWPDNWWSWGRNVVGGVPQAAAVQCRISNAAAGSCVIDSLTSFNPLRNAATSPFTRPGGRSLLGVQASGGTERTRFFASVERESELGPYSMPSAEVARLRTLRGVTPSREQRRPNSLGQWNLRGNFTTALRPGLELTLTGAYTNRDLRTPFGGAGLGVHNQAVTAPGYRTAYNGFAAEHLGEILSVLELDKERRTLFGATTTWTPRDWITAKWTTGIDRSVFDNLRFSRNGEGPSAWLLGLVGQGGARETQVLDQELITSDLLVTAVRTLSPSWRSRTALGSQYVVDRWHVLYVSGANMAPGATLVNAASVISTNEYFSENATLGVYVEENLEWRNRLFLSAGVRTDRNSQFGAGFPRAWYPRAGVSWVASEEAFFRRPEFLESLRLRASWGEAGIQPDAGTALEQLTAGTVVIGGQTVPTLRPQRLGNPALRPETVSEFEFGFELQFANDRASLEVTRFDKRSRNGILNVQLPPSIGTNNTTRAENVARVRNHGLEVALAVTPIERAAFTWSVLLTGSTLRNVVLDDGDLPPIYGHFRAAVERFPVGGLWARPITGWDDTNGDGILVETEVTSDSTWRFVGPSLPTREAALTNTVQLLGGRVTLSAMLDFRGGHYRWWSQEKDRCNGGNCRAVNDPATPLAQQAAAVAALSGRHLFTEDGYIARADFLRLREVSLAWTLPTRVTDAMRARDATLVVSGRNLVMVNSRYPGLDAEGTLPGGLFEVQEARWGVPPLRYWLVRLNLGY